MNDEGLGWYGITIPGANCANIIFNNNATPQTADLMNVCGEQWFDNGWLSQIVPDANLPVRLLSFKAAATPARVELIWKVTAENEVDGYTIERSTNGSAFSPLYTQPARNLNGTQDYRYADVKLPSSAVVYYRIQLVDKDGQVRYSPIIKVNLQATGSLWIANPNPVKQQFTIQATDNAPEVKALRIVNTTGQMVITQMLAPGQRQVRVDRKGMTAGVYWVELADAGGMIVQRIKIMME
jgi:hypothetical protein